MKYYDLNIRGRNYESDLEMILEANRLGWNYINLVYSPEKYKIAIDYKEKLKEEIGGLNHNNKKYPLEFEFGIEIDTKNPNELQKIARKYRNQSKFISVVGGDLKINRAACENRKIDVLSRPYLNRLDSGINHVLAKEAVKNSVAIELSFKDILSSYLSYRAKIMTHFREIIKLHLKFKFPLLITTGSSSLWDIKSPRDISAVFKSLGLLENDINSFFYRYPQEIIKFNNERKDMIVLGAKKINK